MAKKKNTSTKAAAATPAAVGTPDNPGSTNVGIGIDAKVEASDSSFKLVDDTFDDKVIPTFRTPIIDFIIDFCKFPDDSTMVKYIDQQGWTELIHVTTIGLDEIKDFHTVNDDD